MEIETPVLLAYAIEDSTDIFRISGGGWVEHPKPPSRYATAYYTRIGNTLGFTIQLHVPQTNAQATKQQDRRSRNQTSYSEQYFKVNGT